MDINLKLLVEQFVES